MLLTNPIWLFALAAIGIPVVIHLWNIKPGKTLKVGSIALFSESSPKSSRSFKLLDIILLILRCLLLTLLAVLLAAPLWQQHVKATRAKGWILIPAESFNETYKRYKTTVDTLDKAGYEFHYFNKGFAKADLKQLLLHSAKDSLTTLPANYWALAIQLGHRLSNNVPAEVFTPNTINHFTGNKPSTALKLNWHTYTPADSVHTWLADAWLTPAGNIKVVQGTATPAGTSYQYNEVKNGGQAGLPYQVSLDKGQPAVTFNQTTLPVDTTTRRIAVYSDKNITDANYLKAALTAIAQLTQQKTDIKTYSQPEAIPADQNWIFWLSDKTADKAIVQKTKNIFCYAGGKATEVNSWLNNTDTYAVMLGQAKVPLTKIISGKAIGNAVWTDGFGNPVLSLTQTGQTNSYYFYSRFNPAWNDLVWSDAFPKWLMGLTYPNQTNNTHERRMISQAQIQPAPVTGTGVATGTQTNVIDVAKYLWLILIVTFLAERWLATKNKTQLAND